MARTTGSFSLVVVLLAACGGAGTSPTPTGDSGSAPTPSIQPAATDVASDDPLDFGDEANTATVTIGDEQYEFTDLYCVTMGGALGAVSTGGDPKIDIDLPPQDWETSGDDWGPPTIRVSGNDPYLDFRAGDEMFEGDDRVSEGMSQVDSFTSDGVRATGTATFIDTNALMLNEHPDPVTGTFDVTCGD